MKNKIFELYKPKSLQEFLDFKKENPKEDFVYVLQHPAPSMNILSASDFGYLVICRPRYDNIYLSPGPYVQTMRKCFKDIRPQDYILLIGDPAIIGVSSAIVSDMTNGKFKMLKWDRNESRYYPLEFNLYQKGEIDE